MAGGLITRTGAARTRGIAGRRAVTVWLPVLLGASLGLAGCLAVPRFYAEPGPRALRQATARPETGARPLHLTVEVRLHSNAGARASERPLQATVAALLRSGRVSRLVASPEGVDRLRVVVTHRVGAADVAGAVAQGLATGLTFGAIGARTADTFVFTAVYTPAGGEPVHKEYRRAVYAVFGNRSGPRSAPALSSFDEAFDRVMEAFVLMLLHDLHTDARL